MYYRRNARGAEGGVFNTLIPQFFRDSLSRFPARSQKTLGGKLRPSWWACVGRREGRNVLRPWRGGAGRLRVLQPVNTEYVIVFQGWRDVRAGPPRDFTSERSDGKSRSSPKSRRERDWDLW